MIGDSAANTPVTRMGPSLLSAKHTSVKTTSTGLGHQGDPVTGIGMQFDSLGKASGPKHTLAVAIGA